MRDERNEASSRNTLHNTDYANHVTWNVDAFRNVFLFSCSRLLKHFLYF
jgi:hypothetical protein